MKKFREFLEEAVRVDHDAYRRSHMKNPSGKGSWMVGVGTSNIDFSKHKEGEHYIQHNGTVGEAVAKAKEVAKARGKFSVHVLP